MSQKTAAQIAWTLCGLVILTAIGNVVWSLTRYGNMFDLAESVINVVMNIVFGITGALILSHQPRNKVGWLLMLEATLAFFVPVDVYFNQLTQAPTHLSLLTLIGLWLWGWVWLLYIFPIFFIPLFFPTGRLLSARWRWVVGLGLGLCLFFIFFATFMLTFINPNGTWIVSNPIGFLPEAAFPEGLWLFVLIAFGVLCVLSLLVRFLRARQAERDQIKWLLYAMVLFALIYGFSFITNGIGGFIDELVIRFRDLAILMLPVAIAIAILRYRLYDINVVIRKTLVYAVLSGLLALVYFGSVVLLQNVIGRTADEQSPLVIVISTLIIAALFAPLRQRVQAAIDRRFYRKRYDAQQILAQFAQTARDKVEMEALTAELTRVIQETMQPETTTLWLKPTPALPALSKVETAVPHPDSP